MYLTRFRICKIARPPQIKAQEGRGPQIDKHLQQSPFTGQFFKMTTFCFDFFESYLSAPVTLQYKLYVFTTVDKNANSNDRTHHESSCSLKYSKKISGSRAFCCGSGFSNSYVEITDLNSDPCTAWSCLHQDAKNQNLHRTYLLQSTY